MGEEVLVHGEAQGLIDRHHSPSLTMHASHRLNGLSTNERHATNVTYARFVCNTTLNVRHHTVHHERMTERKSYRRMPGDLLTARQVVEQTQLLEERYKNPVAHHELFSVSSQHYAFVVNAFVSLLKKSDMEKYELFLRETRTWEIIDDVKNFRSEIGVLFLNGYNRDVLSKMLDDNHLIATHLFTAQPHIFVSKSNPLAKKNSLTSATTKGHIIPSTFLRKSSPKNTIKSLS